MSRADRLPGSGAASCACGQHRDRCAFGHGHCWSLAFVDHHTGRPLPAPALHCMRCDGYCAAEQFGASLPANARKPCMLTIGYGILRSVSTSKSTRNALPTNAIIRSRLDRRAADAALEAIADQLNEIRSYLTSPKFTEGRGELVGYVNVHDVLLRLRELESASVAAREAVYADATAPDCAGSGAVVAGPDLGRGEWNSDAYAYNRLAWCPTCGRSFEFAPETTRLGVTAAATLPSHTDTADGDRRRALALSGSREAA